MKSAVRCLAERLFLSIVFCSIVGTFWIGSSIFFRDLPASQAARATLYQPPLFRDVVPTEHLCRVLFSPDDDIATTLQGLIDAEQEAIYAAHYILSDVRIARALIQAHQRGVHVELVTDQFCVNSPVGKAMMLANAGIPVYVYKPQDKNKRFYKRDSLMHHKFFVFRHTIDGKQIVTTGSFNCTKAASQENQENCIFLEDAHITAAFQHQFEILKNRSQILYHA